MCFTVIHIDDDSEISNSRRKYFIDIYRYLEDKIEYLNVETFKIFSQQELDDYNEKHDPFKPAENRDKYEGVIFDVIYDSGWHFSWVGDKAFINEKLDGYRHQDNRNIEGRKHLKEEVKMRDFYPEYGTTINITIDSFFPDYIIKNQEKYSSLISKNVSSKSGYDFIERKV
jgi:hypothetical protein